MPQYPKQKNVTWMTQISGLKTRCSEDPCANDVGDNQRRGRSKIDVSPEICQAAHKSRLKETVWGKVPK